VHYLLVKAWAVCCGTRVLSEPALCLCSARLCVCLCVFVLHRSVDIKRKHLLCLLSSQSVLYLQIWFTNLNLSSYSFTTFSISLLPLVPPSDLPPSNFTLVFISRSDRGSVPPMVSALDLDANIIHCLGWESPVVKVTLPKLTQESTKLLYENTQTWPNTCVNRKWGFLSLPLQCNRWDVYVKCIFVLSVINPLAWCGCKW